MGLHATTRKSLTASLIDDYSAQIFANCSIREMIELCSVLSKDLLHPSQEYSVFLWHVHSCNEVSASCFSPTCTTPPSEYSYVTNLRPSSEPSGSDTAEFEIKFVTFTEEGKRSGALPLRHALPRPGRPPLISPAWVCNPRHTLRAQVSSVCPQISFVIPRTPCSGSAASSIETGVFMFVKLFTGMASSSV